MNRDDEDHIEVAGLSFCSVVGLVVSGLLTLGLTWLFTCYVGKVSNRWLYLRHYDRSGS